MISPCAQISQQMGALFSCEEVRGYVRIRTPFMYPDGDIVDVFLRDDGKCQTLTDLGETLRWLRSQTITPRRTAKQRQLIEDVCSTCGIELFRGTLNLRTVVSSEFAEDVTRLAQACVRVADIWFTFRTRAVQSVTDEVADLLEDKHVSFDRQEQRAGRSGRTWTIDFHSRTSQRSSLIVVLATGARAATNRLAEHVVAAWHDLSHLHDTTDVRFVSLFDDTVDVWRPEDFRLLDDLSTVAMWSRPDEFLQVITA